MPFNSSNVFQRLYSWVVDRDNSVLILAERMDSDTDDIVAGINRIMSGEADFVGPLKGVNGTASAPAYSFTDDPDSGFYRAAANTVGVSTGGVKKVEIAGLETRLFNNLVVNAGTITNIQLNNSATSQASFPTPDASVGAPPKIEGEYKDGYVGVVLHPKQTVNCDLAITMKEGDEGGPQWWADAVEYKIWTENNDGAGSGLDADLLDGLQGGSYVKKNNDSGIGNLSFNQGSHLKFPHANQQDADDGKIGSDLFAEGLNIIGSQTVLGGGRKTKLWGDLILADGQLNIPNQPACVVSRGTGWETWAPNTEVGIEGFSLNKGGFYLGSYINSDQRALHLPHPGLYLFIMEMYAQAGAVSRISAIKNGDTATPICFAHGHIQVGEGDKKVTGFGVREMATGDYVSLYTGGYSPAAYHSKDHTQLIILKIG